MENIRSKAYFPTKGSRNDADFCTQNIDRLDKHFSLQYQCCSFLRAVYVSPFQIAGNLFNLKSETEKTLNVDLKILGRLIGRTLSFNHNAVVKPLILFCNICRMYQCNLFKSLKHSFALRGQHKHHQSLFRKDLNRAFLYDEIDLAAGGECN